jgi:hypothetical protein
MKRRLVVSCVLALTTAALIVGCWFVVIINPFEWGAESSRDFTWDKFNAIQRGQSIEQVIDVLGAPIRPATAYENATGNEHTRVCSEGGRCRQYQFAGVTMTGGREAIVIADSATGRVLDKRINYEP